MTAKTIMSRDLVTLDPDETVHGALTLMRDRHMHNLPVVGEDDTFLGLFSLRRLTHALLPKAAQLDQHSLRLNISFVPDDPDALLERLQSIGDKPVTDLLEKKRKLRFCRPETPLPETLKLLYENPVSLPLIVLSEENKLCGIISNWDVLTKVALNLLSGIDRQPERGDADHNACDTDTESKD